MRAVQHANCMGTALNQTSPGVVICTPEELPWLPWLSEVPLQPPPLLFAVKDIAFITAMHSRQEMLAQIGAVSDEARIISWPASNQEQIATALQVARDLKEKPGKREIKALILLPSVSMPCQCQF